LGRFLSADSIIQLATQGVQAWDRFAYANNNPVRFNDPSGHMIACGDGETGACGGFKHFDWVYNEVYGDVDKQANEELAEAIIFGGVETIAGFLWEPADWAFALEDGFQWYDSIGFFPIVPTSAGKAVGKLVGHHTIPVQILKTLPPDLANAVRGVKGAPNIWQIPESLHKIVHSGPGGGGYYNAAWREAIKPLLKRGNITPQEGGMSRVDTVGELFNGV
jgi:hypothetical protein